jgi:hypothetical protein
VSIPNKGVSSCYHCFSHCQYTWTNAKNILEVQGSNSIKLIVEDDRVKVPSLKSTVVKEDITAYLPQGYNINHTK